MKILGNNAKINMLQGLLVEFSTDLTELEVQATNIRDFAELTEIARRKFLIAEILDIVELVNLENKLKSINSELDELLEETKKIEKEIGFIFR